MNLRSHSTRPPPRRSWRACLPRPFLAACSSISTPRRHHHRHRSHSARVVAASVLRSRARTGGSPLARLPRSPSTAPPRPSDNAWAGFATASPARRGHQAGAATRARHQAYSSPPRTPTLASGHRRHLGEAATWSSVINRTNGGVFGDRPVGVDSPTSSTSTGVPPY